jgi:hypothetical protein
MTLRATGAPFLVTQLVADQPDTSPELFGDVRMTSPAPYR